MKKIDPVQNIFHELCEVIKNKEKKGQANSYTKNLLEKGRGEICKKFGEEAIEVIVATLGQKKQNVINESADALYHLFVLWTHLGIELKDVESELKRRFGVSGIAEKKARNLLK